MKVKLNKVNGFDYAVDKLTNSNLLIKDIKYTEWLPSNGVDFTLYLLKNGDCYYYHNASFVQVEPEQEVVSDQKDEQKDAKNGK